jgi:sulfur carrier protein
MRLHLPDGTIHDAGTDPKTAAMLLSVYDINPLEVIVTRNGRLIPEDATVSGNDEVRVFLVAHGG